MIIKGICAKVIIDNLKTEKQKKEYVNDLKETEPEVYESYVKYIEQLNYEIKDYTVNHEVIGERLNDLNNMKIFMPVSLRPYLNLTYYDNLNDDVRDEMVNSYAMFQIIPYRFQYQMEELNWWLQDNPEWESILKNQKIMGKKE